MMTDCHIISRKGKETEHVRESTHCQSRCHCLPHHPHIAPYRSQERCGVYRGRCLVAACGGGRRSTSHRKRSRSRELFACRQNLTDRKRQRRTSDSSRLWLSQ